MSVRDTQHCEKPIQQSLLLLPHPHVGDCLCLGKCLVEVKLSKCIKRRKRGKKASTKPKERV